MIISYRLLCCFLTVFCLGLQFSCSVAEEEKAAVGLGNGIKIGEVTTDRAIIWCRTTASHTPDPTSIEAAAPGIEGKVQISYWPTDDKAKRVDLDPVAVDPRKDYTSQTTLTSLRPGTRYQLEVTALTKEGAEGNRIEASFKTAPRPDQVADVTAIVVTCQGHETVDDPTKGHWAYSHMLTHDPDFFVHTGDVVYYDKDKNHPFSKTVPAARQRWNRMFAYTWNRQFHNQVSSYFMKDDHDTLKNDCWPGQTYGEITWEEGLALFKEQTPQGNLPYRQFQWGNDLEIWLMEGRDYRSPNKMKDGPDKTILGKAQKDWLKKTVKASDATFKLVVFPSPVVGPDKKGKNDNHSNKGFTHEGDEIREFITSIPNTFVVCGDRHWQYASKHPETGLVEICSGPINNAHATIGGNAKKDDNLHLYYGGGKGGYLRVEVTHAEGKPQISFIWHGDRSTNGIINHQMSFSARE
jgi:alkaline phosphatase D